VLHTIAMHCRMHNQTRYEVLLPLVEKLQVGWRRRQAHHQAHDDYIIPLLLTGDHYVCVSLPTEWRQAGQADEAEGVRDS
jgi:hypothetical protein